MHIGVPREVKNNEHRVAITPAGAHQLVAAGHRVLVQQGAGEGSAVPDDAYRAAGADLTPSAEEVWGTTDLVCKVKEPVPAEYGLLRRGQVLFTYLHLAADRPATDALLAAGTTSVAYETVQLPDGTLPLLAPMSEVAGRLSVQVGAYHLMKNAGGAGVLLGGIPGVRPGKVVVIGAGVAGTNATEIARGHARRGHGAGPRPAEAAGDRRRVRRPGAHPGVERVDPGGGGGRRRPGDRCGPRRGRPGPAPGERRARRPDASGLGAGRHRRRPGRVLRVHPAHDARRPHLRRPRVGVLLRGEHAGRRPGDLDARADQRDPAVPHPARDARLAGRAGRRPRARGRPDDARRRPVQRGGGARPRAPGGRPGASCSGRPAGPDGPGDAARGVSVGRSMLAP